MMCAGVEVAGTNFWVCTDGATISQVKANFGISFKVFKNLCGTFVATKDLPAWSLCFR